MSVSTPKIIRYALIVGIMALIGWLMVEPMNRAQERAKIDVMREIMGDLPSTIEDLTRNTSPDEMSNPFKAMRDMSKSMEQMKKEMDEKMRKATGNPYLAISIVTMIVGAMLGVGLALADEIGSLSIKRIAVRSGAGAVVGAVGGFFAGLIAQFLFGLLSGGSPLGGASIIMLVIARSIGWAVAGAMIGVSAGAASGSIKLGLQGMAGGAIGGGIGGFFFDLLSSIGQMPDIMNMSGYQYGTAGRLFAGTLMGVCIGAAVAMVQEYTKQAWIRVLVGKNEGKDYILTKLITSIGRDELADIPLFGDRSIEKQHATVTESINVHTINALGPLAINNQPVNQAQLRDGDLITIGRFTLRFTTRALEAFTFSSSSSSSQTPQPYITTQTSTPQAYTPGANVVPRLRGVNGLLNLSVFDIRSIRVTIGRDTSCDISLAQDTSVSRSHAEITYENGRYILRDLGSTNGVYVNGTRVNEASITPMDIIQIGGTQFQLVFESPGT